MKVLITSCGNKVSLVKAFQNEGAYVIALDADPLSASFGFADEYHICDYGNDSILEAAREIKHDILIPSRDEDVGFFSRHKSELNSLAIVPSLDTVDIVLNKRIFHNTLLSLGYNSAKSFNANEISEEDFPLFARPIYGSGGRGSFKINKWKDLGQIENWNDYIVQRYIDAQEYTIDLFRGPDSVIYGVVPRKRLKVVNGESYLGVTERNEKIIESCTNLANDLDLLYHSTIQCFYDGGEIVFTEINPRFGGGFPLCVAAGVNTPKMILNIARGKKPKKVNNWKEGLYMIRYTDNVFYSESAF